MLKALVCHPPPSSFHCFSIPFSIFSHYSSPFSISGPLTPPPTTTSTPMYNPPTPPLSFLSMCLLPSFFPYPKPSRHIILPVFLFPPVVISLCFSVSLSVSILISLSSLCSIQLFPPFPPFFILPSPALSLFSSVCLWGQRVVRPARRHQQHRATASSDVCVCLRGWLALCPDPPPVVKLFFFAVWTAAQIDPHKLTHTYRHANTFTDKLSGTQMWALITHCDTHTHTHWM